jgi:hypothetical protein
LPSKLFSGIIAALASLAPTPFHGLPIRFGAVDLPVGVVFADNNRMSARREFGFVLHQMLGHFVGISFACPSSKHSRTAIGDDPMIFKTEPIEGMEEKRQIPPAVPPKSLLGEGTRELAVTIPTNDEYAH